MSETDRSETTPLKPGLPLPPPICSDVPGTWAHSTVTERLPHIARRTLDENDFSPQTAARVQALIDEIPETPIRQLRQAAPDAALWAEATAPYVGEDWRDPPWFFTETYFYRRLLEATGYFEVEDGKGLDPFLHQKEEGLRVMRPLINAVSERLASWEDGGWQGQHLAALLNINLWGNRADLSLWPADAGEDQPLQGHWEGAEEHTMVDETAAVIAYLEASDPGRVDFVVDNAGLELVTDLALADYLLATGTAKQVHLNLKMHPTFVSDAMIKDVVETVRVLAEAKEGATAAFGDRLQGYVDDDRLLLSDHPFWTSPYAFWDLPSELRQDLRHSQLLISKGDANYRRLLGDRHWPFTTSFQTIMRYALAPLLALRALKSELACGLTEGQIAWLNEEDPQWLVNGKWGVIQFSGSVVESSNSWVVG